MATYHELYLHLVWSTHRREPTLTPQVAQPIYACIRSECREMGVDVVAIGGIEDHVHLLVRFPPTLAPAALAKQVKGA